MIPLPALSLVSTSIGKKYQKLEMVYRNSKYLKVNLVLSTELIM